MRCVAGGSRTAGEKKHILETTQQTRRFLAAGDWADARTGAKLLADPQPCMNYVFSMAIEPIYWEAAHAVGLGRTLIKKLRGRKAFEGRGADDERIDTEGALAEILLSQLLEKAGATIAPLVAHKPDYLGVDILLAGKRLDVKSIGQGRANCNINSQQHAAKAADAYLLVRLTRSDVADVFVVSQAGVSDWEHRTGYNGKPMDPGRHYYAGRLPTTLPALAEIEA